MIFPGLRGWGRERVLKRIITSGEHRTIEIHLRGPSQRLEGPNSQYKPETLSQDQNHPDNYNKEVTNYLKNEINK